MARRHFWLSVLATASCFPPPSHGRMWKTGSVTTPRAQPTPQAISADRTGAMRFPTTVLAQVTSMPPTVSSHRIVSRITSVWGRRPASVVAAPGLNLSSVRLKARASCQSVSRLRGSVGATPLPVRVPVMTATPAQRETGVVTPGRRGAALVARQSIVRARAIAGRTANAIR